MKPFSLWLGFVVYALLAQSSGLARVAASAEPLTSTVFRSPLAMSRDRPFSLFTGCRRSRKAGKEGPTVHVPLN